MNYIQPLTDKMEPMAQLFTIADDGILLKERKKIESLQESNEDKAVYRLTIELGKLETILKERVFTREELLKIYNARSKNNYVITRANMLLREHYNRKIQDFEKDIFSVKKRMTRDDLDTQSYLIFCNKKFLDFDSLEELEAEAKHFVEASNRLQDYVAYSLGLRSRSQS